MDNSVDIVLRRHAQPLPEPARQYYGGGRFRVRLAQIFGKCFEYHNDARLVGSLVRLDVCRRAKLGPLVCGFAKIKELMHSLLKCRYTTSQFVYDDYSIIPRLQSASTGAPRNFPATHFAIN